MAFHDRDYPDFPTHGGGDAAEAAFKAARQTNLEAETAMKSATPLESALAHAAAADEQMRDALERLNKQLAALAEKLEPILTDGSPANIPMAADWSENATDQAPDRDTRSHLTRRVDALASTIDAHTHAIRQATGRVEALRMAVEL